MKVYTEQQYLEAGEPGGPLDSLPPMPLVLRLVIRVLELFRRSA